MELYINAFAHYLPDNRVPNSYFKDVNGLDDEWIRTRTGISTRSKAGENENTNTMALEAVKRLHEKLPFPIEEVDLIVAATYSPHDTVATAAHMIQRHFKARAARCLTVSAACSSFINAMEIVEGYFAMNKATKAIVVASEHNTEYSNETCPQSGHLWTSLGPSARPPPGPICRQGYKNRAKCAIIGLYLLLFHHVSTGKFSPVLQVSNRYEEKIAPHAQPPRGQSRSEK